MLSRETSQDTESAGDGIEVIDLVQLGNSLIKLFLNFWDK